MMIHSLKIFGLPFIFFVIYVISVMFQDSPGIQICTWLQSFKPPWLTPDRAKMKYKNLQTREFMRKRFIKSLRINSRFND